jgi:hypothetical protein
MALTWAQRREALLSDYIVSPDVFTPMIDRLAAFIVPYQQAMETEAAQRNMHLSPGVVVSPPKELPPRSVLLGRCGRLSSLRWLH